MLGAVNAAPSIIFADPKNLFDASQKVKSMSGDEYVAKYRTEIDYNTDLMDSLLMSDGYEELYGSVSSTIIKKRTVIQLSNPLGIEVDGCSTISGNLDEALTILLHALNNALGVIPNLAASRMFGLPNLDNPKEIFNWVYDMSTTVICMGTSGITTAVETGVFAIPTMIKQEYATWNKSEGDDSTNTQIGALCGFRQDKDEYSEEKTQGLNQNADTKAKGQITGNALLSQDKKFLSCKDKYEEYKKYISKEITLLDIYKERQQKATDTACSLLAAEKESNEGDALTGGGKEWNISNPFYLSVSQPEIFKMSFGPLDVSMKFNENASFDRSDPNNVSKIEKTEILVDKKKLVNEVLNIQGKIPYYVGNENSTEISQYIYNIGSTYANIVSGCLNDDPQYASVCNEQDIEDYFPIKMGKNNKYTSLLEAVSKKSILCDLTYFNKDNDDFLISSIGLITMIDNDKKGFSDHPPVADLRSAIETVFLEDYCDDKLALDLYALEDAMKESLVRQVDDINQKEKALLSAAKVWKDQEMVVSIPSQYNNKDVIKVCNVFPEQENYYIATGDKAQIESWYNAGAGSAPRLNIEKIAVKGRDIKKFEKELRIQNQNTWEKCDYGLEEKCGFIENGIYAPLETEILCDGVPLDLTGAVGSATIGSCEINKVSCGINFEKKTEALRTDKLYIDNDSESNPKGKYAQYALKQKEDKQNVSEEDFAEKIDLGFKKQIDKILYFTGNVLSKASKDLILFVDTEIKKIMIVLRK